MESTYLLYDATGDERYVEAGRKLQERLFQKNRVACGFAGVGDVTTGACGLRVRTAVLRKFRAYRALRLRCQSRARRNLKSWKLAGALKATSGSGFVPLLIAQASTLHPLCYYIVSATCYLKARPAVRQHRGLRL